MNTFFVCALGPVHRPVTNASAYTGAILLSLICWSREAQAEDLLGANVRMFAGITVTGPVGTVCEIQFVNSLGQTNGWQTLTNLPLPSSPYLFVDTSSPATHSRFYRAIVAERPMAAIPVGTFQMGSSSGGPDEAPVHAVTVGSFSIDITEVTGTHWETVKSWALTNGYTFASLGFAKASDHPTTATWYDAVKWCNARSERAGLMPCYYTTTNKTVVYRSGQIDVSSGSVDWSASGYRLPTEAEWEKAARGGLAGRRFPWGDTITHSNANYFSDGTYAYDFSLTEGYHPTYNDGVQPYTNPVDHFETNGFGLKGMSGNVWEWCWDWYSGSYYSSSPQNEPLGPTTGVNRVMRGGGWQNSATATRTSFRNTFVTPDLPVAGFRCVKRGAK